MLDDSAMSSSVDIEVICRGISRFESAVSTLPFEGDVKGFNDGAAPSPQSFIMQTLLEDVKQTARSSPGDTAMATIFSFPFVILANATAFNSLMSHKKTTPSTP